MWRRDNWGWRARFGVLIVADDHVPEPEWWAMAPEGVSIHMARVASGGFRRIDAASDSTRAFEDVSDVERGAEMFARMQLDAVVLGHSSSSFIGGKGWDEDAIEQLGRRTNGIRVTTNGLDCLAALRAVGARRPMLILPPWYADSVVEGGLRYFADWGVTLAGHYRYDAGPGWNHLAPNEIYRQGANAAQDPARLYHQVKAHTVRDADAVLIVGTGFRAVGAIEPLEQDLNRPVITANQASFWHCLRLAGVRTPVTGYGRLFDL